MSINKKLAITFAVLAAALYAVSTPLSKLLLLHVSPTMLAAFLYIGAGVGMGIMTLILKLASVSTSEQRITKRDLPYTTAMVLLDIAAPILMLFGLKMTTAANASLLNNFEIVATALIAMMFFGEKVDKRLWIAIGFVSVACLILTFNGNNAFSFSLGSVLVLGATVCWGLENNCTRQIADKDPKEIVTVKGLGSGAGAFIIALCVGETIPSTTIIILTMLLGFVAYGLSIYFYTYAQRGIGAARTSTYYALAPFIGAVLSFVILREQITPLFCIALLFMIVGAWLAAK